MDSNTILAPDDLDDLNDLEEGEGQADAFDEGGSGGMGEAPAVMAAPPAKRRGMNVIAEPGMPGDDPFAKPAKSEDEAEDDSGIDEELAAYLGPDRFPLEVLPHNVRRIITEIGDNKRAHREMVFMHLLSLASACTGGALTLCPHPEIHKTWREPCTIWGMTVGSSGETKTPTAKLIFGPLERMQKEEEDLYESEYAKFLRAVEAYDAKEEHDPNEEPPIEPGKTQYYVDDTTIEAIHAILKSNQAGVLWRKDEIRGLLKNLNKYNKGDSLDVLLSLWSGFWWTVNRSSKKGRGSQASDTVYGLAAIYGGIQPGVLEHFFSMDDVFAGLVQRFLFCHLSGDIRKSLKTPPISEATLDQIEILTRRMLDNQRHARTLHLTEEAFERFNDYYEVVANHQPRDFLMKSTNNCLRIALALHQLADPALIKDKDHIEAWEIEAAITLTKWFLVTLFKRIMPLLSVRKAKSDELTKVDEERRIFLEDWIKDYPEYCDKPRTSTEILKLLPKKHPFVNGENKPSAYILGTTLTHMGYKQRKTGKARIYDLSAPMTPGANKRGTIGNDGRIEFNVGSDIMTDGI